ncbi:hypothetical protein Leucomu_13455 [Leucobacter muris]|uniref:Uncharacterized protein n=1 Tax=Leucobacter muris TaxID=1935379 RepID=A0ABX5QIL2_9MICO|nr:hypothetical protein [Leucobacter muris]QAB18781.1 hypothetical protein Leucomu_13455 [Leucobacter muris]
MAVQIGSVIGRVLIQIGDGDAIEVGTLDIGSISASTSQAPQCRCREGDDAHAHVKLHLNAHDHDTVADALAESLRGTVADRGRPVGGVPRGGGAVRSREG